MDASVYACRRHGRPTPRSLQALAAYRVACPDAARTSPTNSRDFCIPRRRVFDRAHLVGHFTGSAWLVSADGERVLLTHHRKLNAWLQLGGHADGDVISRVSRCAKRKRSRGSAISLSSRRSSTSIGIAFRRGADEPEHWHYDVRYVVRATASEAFVVGDESHALAWRDVRELVEDDGVDASVRRMAAKWLARG